MAVDERVRSAMENWAPRFVANGVDLNDFQRVTQRIERWDDWCHEWSACAAMHAHLGEDAEAQRCYTSAAQHYFHAAMAYHFGKFLFVQRPEELRAAHEQTVRSYQRALPYLDYPGERVAIPYAEGEVMYGILRKPWHTPRPPVIILIPGLDSVKEELHAYGDDFLRRGMATLAMWACSASALAGTTPRVQQRSSRASKPRLHSPDSIALWTVSTVSLRLHERPSSFASKLLMRRSRVPSWSDSICAACWRD